MVHGTAPLGRIQPLCTVILNTILFQITVTKAPCKNHVTGHGRIMIAPGLAFLLRIEASLSVQ
jgi:hypothetical protein